MPARPRRRFVSVREPFEGVMRILDEERPDLLTGYGGWLHLFFKTAAARGSSFHRPRMVMYMAEAMPPGGRELIEDEFGIAVMSRYSAAEAFKIGYFCERRSGFHLHEDLCHVRVVDEDGEPVPDGQPGRLVITNLVNRGSVLLNYPIGDLGSVGPADCGCGRTFRMLSELEGRVEDVLALPDGSSVHPRAVWQAFKDDEEVLQYQLVQHEPARFELRLTTLDEAAFERAHGARAAGARRPARPRRAGRRRLGRDAGPARRPQVQGCGVARAPLEAGRRGGWAHCAANGSGSRADHTASIHRPRYGAMKSDQLSGATLRLATECRRSGCRWIQAPPHPSGARRVRAAARVVGQRERRQVEARAADQPVVDERAPVHLDELEPAVARVALELRARDPAMAHAAQQLDRGLPHAGRIRHDLGHARVAVERRALAELVHGDARRAARPCRRCTCSGRRRARRRPGPARTRPPPGPPARAAPRSAAVPLGCRPRTA